MSDYPEKTCEIDRLVTKPALIEAALAGHKVQQRRNGVYGYPGETFTLADQTFVITALERQTLGEMTEADATSEGYADFASYQQSILDIHPGMQWRPEGRVWVHSFEKA